MPVRVLIAFLFYAAACHGAPPIAGDGSMNTAISRTGNAWSINGGTQLGGNLFQSFSQFNVLTGHSATFYGPNSVQNIVGRVTGPNASSIDGVLRSAIPGANLWLMNPKGVMFGPNASLDISGSFHVTTADYLKLGPAGQFNATNPAGSTLVSAPPSAFGFVNPTPAPISFDQSFLYMTPGKNLSILAGSVQINDASLFAVGGRIDIAAVGGVGEVALAANGMVVPPLMSLGSVGITRSGLVTDNYDGFAFSDTPGRVVLQGGTVTVSDSGIYAGTFGSSDGGGVTLRATDTISIDNSWVFSDSFWSGRAGDLIISAGEISIRNGSLLISDANSSGAGGQVSIAASGSLTISSGSTVSANTFDSGLGGNVTLRANDIVRVSGGLVSANTEGGGNGGSVLVEAARIEVSEEGGIIASTFGSGHGGNVTLRASDFVHVSAGAASFLEGVKTDTDGGGSGNGGAVLIEAPRIEVTGYGQIAANNTYGTGLGGTVTLRASDLVLVSGSVTTTAGSYGNGGAVLVEAARIEVSEGGEISANTLFIGQGGNVTLRASDFVHVAGGHVTTETWGAGPPASVHGNGGAVLVEAPRVSVSNGGFIGARSLNFGTTNTGNAGSITINAADSLQLTGGSWISAATFGAGSGGNVDVRAGQITMSNARISTESEEAGPGGNVNVRAGRLDMGPDSYISASAFGTGGAGSIFISAPVLNMNGGLIRSTSDGTGLAGNILIHADQVLRLTGGAQISTRALLSDGGNISIFVRDLVHLRDSSITTSVQSGSGSGGNIFIDPQFVILDNSQILANAFGGNGGNISIVADNFLSQNSTVEASSNLGLPGSVQIVAPKVDVNSGLTTLNAGYLDASGLMRESCAARAGRSQANSFTGTGRGGLAQGPDQGLAPASVVLTGGAQIEAGRLQLASAGCQ